MLPCLMGTPTTTTMSTSTATSTSTTSARTVDQAQRFSGPLPCALSDSIHPAGAQALPVRPFSRRSARSTPSGAIPGVSDPGWIDCDTPTTTSTSPSSGDDRRGTRRLLSRCSSVDNPLLPFVVSSPSTVPLSPEEANLSSPPTFTGQGHADQALPFPCLGTSSWSNAVITLESLSRY